MASDWKDFDDKSYAIDDRGCSTEAEEELLSQRLNLKEKDWQCNNCGWVNLDKYIIDNENQCDCCYFRKPKYFDWKNYACYADDLLSGYCREVRNKKSFRFSNIPIHLINMIRTFYIIKLQKEMTIITQPTENGIYIWNFSIIPNKSKKLNLWNDINIGLEHRIVPSPFLNIPYNPMKKKLKLRNDISIGLQQRLRLSPFLNIILTNQNRVWEKYCPQFKIGDTITMQLNYNDRSLSFGINNDWYSQFATIGEDEKYKATFNSMDPKINIKLNYVIIIPSPVQRICSMVDKMDNINTDMVKHALISEKHEDKDKLILFLLLNLMNDKIETV